MLTANEMLRQAGNIDSIPLGKKAIKLGADPTDKS
jgi:hypothetical protein